MNMKKKPGLYDACLCKRKTKQKTTTKTFFFPERIIHEYIRLDKLYTEKKEEISNDHLSRLNINKVDYLYKIIPEK
jgi:hypothetical protein